LQVVRSLARLLSVQLAASGRPRSCTNHAVAFPFCATGSVSPLFMAAVAVARD
jgi:hypothetical protein